MIKILTTTSIAEEIYAHPKGKFSLEGAYILAEHLDKHFPTLTIFCAEDIYCEWDEFSSAIMAAEAYDWQYDGLFEDKADSAFFWLDHHTTILDVESVNIIQGKPTIVLPNSDTGGRVIVRSFYI